MNFLPLPPPPTILRCAELTTVAAAASATVKLLRAALNISASERVDGLGKDDYTSGFNRMRLNAYQIRALSLAAPPWSEAPAPVKPWLHFRGTLHGPPGGLFDPVVRLDYYPELVFHYAMSGAHDFYFFNPSQCKNETPPNGLWPVADDLRVLSESLAELTSLAGCAFVERNWVADTDPPRLRDHVMLTGMRLGPKESAHSLWRLTIPTRSDNRTAASLLSTTATGALNVSGLSLQGPSGTQIDGCDLVLPGAQVLTAPSVSSELGVWIQQRHGAALPFTQCPGGWMQPWINASSGRRLVKTDDIVGDLKALAGLRHAGDLTDEEFAHAKALLFSPATPPVTPPPPVAPVPFASVGNTTAYTLYVERFGRPDDDWDVRINLAIDAAAAGLSCNVGANSSQKKRCTAHGVVVQLPAGTLVLRRPLLWWHKVGHPGERVTNNTRDTSCSNVSAFAHIENVWQAVKNGMPSDLLSP